MKNQVFVYTRLDGWKLCQANLNFFHQTTTSNYCNYSELLPKIYKVCLSCWFRKFSSQLFVQHYVSFYIKILGFEEAINCAPCITKSKKKQFQINFISFRNLHYWNCWVIIIYRRIQSSFPLGGTVLAWTIPAELAVCHYAIWRHPEDTGETSEKVPQTSLSIVYISCY